MTRVRREGLCSLHSMSLPAMVEGDFLLDDGDATLAHFRRHGSQPAAQEFCDAAVPGLASWNAGRQAWVGAQHRKWSNAAPAYTDGPPYVHLVGVVPDEVLDIVDRIGWSSGLVGANRVFLGDHYGEEQRLVPRVEELLTRTADEVLAEHPFAFDVEPAAILYLNHRCPGGDVADGSHVHADGAYDPWRRWVNLVAYFTDPAEYVGGDLVIMPAGTRVRPGRGDVILIRGDVAHQVEPLTAGARTTLTAAAAEPRWWLDPRDDLERAHPDERCRVLDRMFTAGLDGPTLRRALALAWNGCHYPEVQLPAERWVDMFRTAGFLTDRGQTRPTGQLVVFRACNAGFERRLTWTTSLATARWFAEDHDRAEIWTAFVPADAVLGWLGDPSATEVIVDPCYLDGVERIEPV